MLHHILSVDDSNSTLNITCTVRIYTDPALLKTTVENVIGTAELSDCIANRMLTDHLALRCLCVVKNTMLCSPKKDQPQLECRFNSAGCQSMPLSSISMLEFDAYCGWTEKSNKLPDRITVLIFLGVMEKCTSFRSLSNFCSFILTLSQKCPPSQCLVDHPNHNLSLSIIGIIAQCQ